MSDTPRTDAVHEGAERENCYIRMFQHARILELENVRLREALRQVATVPVDGNGRDYYWVGRAIAQKALNLSARAKDAV